MFALSILCIFEPLAEMPNQVVHLPTEFENPDRAALRAMRWLMYRPNDIVMLLEEAK